MALTRGQEARAWVNFNGTGTVAIRDSFNVSSITDNGTGNYTVNFDQAMPDENYAVVCGTYAFHIRDGALRTVSGLQIVTYNSAAVLTDYAWNHVVIFGDPS